MTWLQFFSSILVGWAWPALVVIAFFALRNKLAWLAEQFEEIGLPGGGHIKFRKRLAETQKAAEEAAVEGELGRPESAIRPDDPFLELAERFPSAAVLEAFKGVEAVLDPYRKEIGQKLQHNNLHVLHKLHRDGYIGATLVSLYKRVAATRNEAVHSHTSTITPGEVVLYRELCEQLIHGLEVGLRKRQEEQRIVQTATEKVEL